MTNPLPVDYHRLATAEVHRTWRWYARRSATAAAGFEAEITRATAEIGANPAQWSPHLYGTRCFQLAGYPHIVVYVELTASVLVVAVTHTSRRRGYWRRRLSNP